MGNSDTYYPVKKVCSGISEKRNIIKWNPPFKVGTYMEHELHLQTNPRVWLISFQPWKADFTSWFSAAVYISGISFFTALWNFRVLSPNEGPNDISVARNWLKPGGAGAVRFYFAGNRVSLPNQIPLNYFHPVPVHLYFTRISRVLRLPSST